MFKDMIHFIYNDTSIRNPACYFNIFVGPVIPVGEGA
jgi:hypothetical protein